MVNVEVLRRRHCATESAPNRVHVHITPERVSINELHVLVAADVHAIEVQVETAVRSARCVADQDQLKVLPPAPNDASTRNQIGPEQELVAPRYFRSLNCRVRLELASTNTASKYVHRRVIAVGPDVKLFVGAC